MQNIIAKVDLQAILHNADLISARARVPLIAVVKDDAYGHGAERVALALRGRAAAFAVATVEEGAALRIAGVREEILVFTPPLDVADAVRGIFYRLTATLSSRRSLCLLREGIVRSGRSAPAHLALNTGMNRFGFSPADAADAALAARDCGIEVRGMYSHFYLPADVAAREEQYSLFRTAAEEVKKYFPDALFHLAATGGTLAGEKYRFGAVRCGIGLYGYLPDGFCGALPVVPALRLYAPVASCGRAVGGGVGYARAKVKYERLHTVRAGYGDGFFRAGGLGGEGKLCMDACIAEGSRKEGSWKRILSDLTGYARAHGTTEYEVLTRITKRAVMKYV